VRVEGGNILSVSPHFQSRPFDEERRNGVFDCEDGSYEIVSHTSRLNAFEDKATNDIVLKIEGAADTKLTVIMSKPVQMTISKSLAELSEANDIVFTGSFSSESMMLHRVVSAENYESEFSFLDEAEDGLTDWYYVRVVQSNGSLAWSSPIWLEAVTQGY